MHYLAQNLELPGGAVIQGKLDATKFSNVGGIITALIPFLFSFAGLGLLIMLLAAGFTFLTSAGDAKQMEKGKQQLTWAIAGFLIIFLAYWLTQILGRILGLESIGTIFK